MKITGEGIGCESSPLQSLFLCGMSRPTEGCTERRFDTKKRKKSFMQGGEVVIIFKPRKQIVCYCTRVHPCASPVPDECPHSSKPSQAPAIQTSRHLSSTSKVPLPLCVMCCVDTAVCRKKKKTHALAGAESFKS